MASEPMPEQEGAYSLLSKPAISWTDAQVEVIVRDLREKRDRFLQGVQDKPAAKGRAPAKTAEEKQALTNDLLGDLLNG